MKNIILLGLICIALTSCTYRRYIYNPSTIYNPILSGKGENNVTIRYTGGPSDNVGPANNNKNHNNGIDVQAAYAVSKNFAFTATFSRKWEKDLYNSGWGINGYSNYDSAVVRYNRQNWQIGVGSFFPFNMNKSSFSIYGYFGMGMNKINESGLEDTIEYNHYHNSNSLIYSIQPAINLGLKSRLTSSIISRLTFIRNHDINTSYSIDELVNSGLYDINSLVYFALGYNLKWNPFTKVPWLNFEGQYLTSYYAGKLPRANYSRGYNASIGISFEPSKLFKKK